MEKLQTKVLVIIQKISIESLYRNEVAMKRLVSVAEMKAIEQEADARGLSYAQMMENAGCGVAGALLALGQKYSWRSAVGLAGPGNNGGDTLVALEQLARAGWNVRAICVRRSREDELVNRLLMRNQKVLLIEDDPQEEKLRSFLENSHVLLDGLLGTGVRLPLKEEMAAVLRKTRAILDTLADELFVVAVDCPSGVDCDSGAAADECLKADLTLTMACVKQGLLKLPAFSLVGDLQVVDIGLPPDLPALEKVKRFIPEPAWVADRLPPRPLDAHKGTFGTALLVVGSVPYTGAAYLAAMAAYRVGAGLVTLALPAPLHAALAGHLPEATWLLLPHQDGFISAQAAEVIRQNLGHAAAMLIGCGFGLQKTTEQFLSTLLNGNLSLPPLVVDADGLKLLVRLPDWPKKLPAQTVLTPHPGEMAILTGLSKEEIQADRNAVAARYAEAWGHVVVLKGAFTVIAAPDGRVAVLPFATPALARAGTGDVLAGLIVGLRAQGMEAFEAAVAGAWIHAQAGLNALGAAETSAAVLASDLLQEIGGVLAELTIPDGVGA